MSAYCGNCATPLLGLAPSHPCPFCGCMTAVEHPPSEEDAFHHIKVENLLFPETTNDWNKLALEVKANRGTERQFPVEGFATLAHLLSPDKD